MYENEKRKGEPAKPVRRYALLMLALMIVCTVIAFWRPVWLIPPMHGVTLYIYVAIMVAWLPLFLYYRRDIQEAIWGKLFITVTSLFLSTAFVCMVCSVISMNTFKLNCPVESRGTQPEFYICEIDSVYPGGWAVFERVGSLPVMRNLSAEEAEAKLREFQ